MTSMNISIPEGLRKFVEARVRTGGYGSASEYVRELIRNARDRSTKEAELRELLASGINELERGEAIDLDGGTLPEFFDEVKARARKRLLRWRRHSGNKPKRK